MFSSKTLGILTLIAVICFLILIGLQVAELLHYQADPSVWPTS